MLHFTDGVEIERPPAEVWPAIGAPERWLEGYLETRSRSADYPGPGTRDDHLYRTRLKEEVATRVTRSETPSVLEEDQEGKTFSRYVRYTRSPSNRGTSVRVEDDVKLQGPRQAGRTDRLARHQDALADLAREAEGCGGGRRVGRGRRYGAGLNEPRAPLRRRLDGARDKRRPCSCGRLRCATPTSASRPCAG